MTNDFNMVDTTFLYHRIKAWQDTGQPPHLGFTEGLERIVATLVWEAINERKGDAARSYAAGLDNGKVLGRLQGESKGFIAGQTLWAHDSGHGLRPTGPMWNDVHAWRRSKEHAEAYDQSEKIKAAAIRTAEGKVFTLPPPNRHHDILAFCKDERVYSIQGFITTEDRFVDRREALLIAIAKNQLNKDAVAPPNLFSEDLW